MLPSISGLLVFLCAWVVAAEGSADGLPGWPKVFDFAVSWGESAPADIKRNMLLVNGQSPGPVIEVDQGDEVVLRVHNHSPFNTSVHLHGMDLSAGKSVAVETGNN